MLTAITTRSPPAAFGRSALIYVPGGLIGFGGAEFRANADRSIPLRGFRGCDPHQVHQLGDHCSVAALSAHSAFGPASLPSAENRSTRWPLVFLSLFHTINVSRKSDTQRFCLDWCMGSLQRLMLYSIVWRCSEIGWSSTMPQVHCLHARTSSC
jgi:hypothetical protein